MFEQPSTLENQQLENLSHDCVSYCSKHISNEGTTGLQTYTRGVITIKPKGKHLSTFMIPTLLTIYLSYNFMLSQTILYKS